MLSVHASGAAAARDFNSIDRGRRAAGTEGKQTMNDQQATAVAGPVVVEQPRVVSMWREQRKQIAAHFDHLSARGDDGPETRGYNSRAEQRAGFRVLAESLPLNGRRVLDVGCGLADFADYLSVNYGPVGYEGVDISAGVISEARRRHPALNLRVLDILEGNPGGPYDYVLANGVFHLLGEQGFEIMTDMIRCMYGLSRRAMAFTTRSAWAYPPAPGEFRAEPFETLAFCRTLTPRVVLRHDYSSRNFAVIMYRRRPGR